MKKITTYILLVWMSILTCYLFYNNSLKNTVYIDLVKVHDEFLLTKELNEEYDAIGNQQQNILDSLMQVRHFEDEAENYEYLRNQNIQFSENMNKISNTYNNQIWKRINQYIVDYGKEKNLDFVFGTKGEGTVMYSKEALDKTEEVILYINLKYAGKK